MRKFALAAAVMIAASPAAAQQGAAPATPAGSSEVQKAAIAFGQCVQTGAQALAVTVVPETGAATVLAGCTTQKHAMERAAEALIASPAVPADKKEAARAQLRTQLAAVPAQIADGIRQMRAAAAAAPTAVPAQPNK